VGYLPLAGAQRAGIPNAALCSLNWFDIYRHYCGEDTVAAQIKACYANADAFLRATPGMAMETLPNTIPVSPIAEIGQNHRQELNGLLRLSKEEKLVLVSMGGIASRLPMERWPRIDGVRWLVQESWQVGHPDVTVLESLPMSFNDLLASCDVLLCKPGYGSFVEAACSATPVLYVGRPDWPEAPALIEWLQKHGAYREVERKQLESGNIAEELSALFCTPKHTPPIPDGAAQVTDWVIHNLLQ
jgi:UDP:flavonoid glycosyltransferase YjiC (YdhE family)